MSDEIKLDVQHFVDAATDLEPVLKDMRVQFKAWQDAVAELRRDWMGKTSNDIRNTAKQIKQSSDYIDTRLTAYQATIKELAGIYDKGESAVREKSRSLKSPKANGRP